MRFLFRIGLIIILNALGFWILDQKIFIETFQIQGGTQAYLYIAAIFALINTVLRPILSLITLPLRILTLGLFHFFLNALLLWILEHSVNFLEFFGAQMEISGLATYILAGLGLSFLNAVLHALHE
ncbi:phage holin family protein [Candidatus Gracilibacteria bacterium]|nr:phage holin family protein [Candidatus Gracilibacteria bacterium]